MTRYMRVLIVQSDPVLQARIMSTLFDLGAAHLIVVSSYEEARTATEKSVIDKQKIHLIFLDGSESVAGADFISYVMGHPILSESKIVILRQGSESIAWAFQLGALSHLQLPFEPEKVVKLLRGLSMLGTYRSLGTSLHQDSSQSIVQNPVKSANVNSKSREDILADLTRRYLIIAGKAAKELQFFRLLENGEQDVFPVPKKAIEKIRQAADEVTAICQEVEFVFGDDHFFSIDQLQDLLDRLENAYEILSSDMENVA